MHSAKGTIQCPCCNETLRYTIAEFNGKTYLALQRDTKLSGADLTWAPNVTVDPPIEEGK